MAEAIGASDCYHPCGAQRRPLRSLFPANAPAASRAAYADRALHFVTSPALRLLDRNWKNIQQLFLRLHGGQHSCPAPGGRFANRYRQFEPLRRRDSHLPVQHVVQTRISGWAAEAQGSTPGTAAPYETRPKEFALGDTFSRAPGPFRRADGLTPCSRPSFARRIAIRE